MTFDESQLAAINSATVRRFSIITGGAGTGKTTIIDAITRQCESNGQMVLLSAFAGKAAARLREATKHPASTIHRMLGFDGAKFQRESLSEFVVIIDEASMVSSDLLAEVVNRGPARLVLVGDPAQLPPVGRGQPFHDLIDVRPDVVRELSTCYRATEAVYMAASEIRAGNMPPINAVSTGEKWDMVNTGNPNRTQEKILEWVDAGHLDFAEDIILCPRNGDNADQPSTVRGLNLEIVRLIGQDGDARSGEKDFRPGDRVINTVNIAPKDVWNGSTGTVHSIDMDGGIWVTMDIPVIDADRTSDPRYPVYKSKVLFTKAERKWLQWAYALSVHKSQGSQYRRVVFVALNRDSWSLLDRSLIYTAVTRTREQCIVVGEIGAVRAGIGNCRKKRTVIQEITA